MYAQWLRQRFHKPSRKMLLSSRASHIPRRAERCPGSIPSSCRLIAFIDPGQRLAMLQSSCSDVWRVSLYSTMYDRRALDGGSHTSRETPATSCRQYNTEACVKAYNYVQAIPWAHLWRRRNSTTWSFCPAKRAPGVWFWRLVAPNSAWKTLPPSWLQSHLTIGSGPR